MSGKVHHYRGESISVTWDARRCIHAKECVHGLPGVFDPEQRPWVRVDEAAADEVAAVVARCPTGALKFERPDGAAEPVPGENVVTVDPDGPLYAHGDIEVLDAEKEVVTRETRVALCRCGASSYKPFCDGSHEKAGFAAPGAIPDPRLRGEPSEGKLTVVVAANGPLILRGPVTVVGGEDRCSGNQGALCRCGESENKPFCDGTHAKVGFTDG